MPQERGTALTRATALAVVGLLFGIPLAAWPGRPAARPRIAHVPGAER